MSIFVRFDDSKTRAEVYRFGFNGMEKDNETYGEGNALDFGARIFDSRLGRWLSVDELGKEYPALSPYVFVNNSPLIHVDPDGKQIRPLNAEAEKALLLLLTRNSKTVAWTRNAQGVYNIDWGRTNIKKLNDEAKTLVKVLAAPEIIEVQITRTATQTQATTTDAGQGTNGSRLVGSGSNTVNRDLTNANEIVLGNENNIMTQSAEAAIYKGAPYTYTPDPQNPGSTATITINPAQSGNNWVFFDNKNKSLKSPALGGTVEQNTGGEILINGVQSMAENAKTLLNATSKVVKDGIK